MARFNRSTKKIKKRLRKKTYRMKGGDEGKISIPTKPGGNPNVESLISDQLALKNLECHTSSTGCGPNGMTDVENTVGATATAAASDGILNLHDVDRNKLRNQIVNNTSGGGKKVKKSRRKRKYIKTRKQKRRRYNKSRKHRRVRKY